MIIGCHPCRFTSQLALLGSIAELSTSPTCRPTSRSTSSSLSDLWVSPPDHDDDIICFTPNSQDSPARSAALGSPVIIAAAPPEPLGILSPVGLRVDLPMTIFVPVVPCRVIILNLKLPRVPHLGILVLARPLAGRVLLIDARPLTFCAPLCISITVTARPHVVLGVLSAQRVAVDDTMAPLVVVGPVIVVHLEHPRVVHRSLIRIML
mmetsp:Transcript_25238/g.49152  ORF Transcript_25238/g.49152 Transcript_25238/m.49152 type:complete len:208 (+) Transcript_25238:475-1098(+)